MSPGRLDALQEGNPENTVIDCPHMPKDEMLGKKAGLAKQRALVGTQRGKNRGYDL